MNAALSDDLIFLVQLLHKLFIRGVNGPEKLLRVIKVSKWSLPRAHLVCNRTQKLNPVKNPVTDHFPMNTYKITLSRDAPTVRLSHYLPCLPKTHSIAVFVGAMARGRDDFADAVVDEKVSISNYQLSASVACGKVRKRHLLRFPC